MINGMEVCTLAEQALKNSPFPALRRLRVEKSEGAIVLRGKVPSFYYKQLAQETVRPYLQDKLEWRNEIDVIEAFEQVEQN